MLSKVEHHIECMCQSLCINSMKTRIKLMFVTKLCMKVKKKYIDIRSLDGVFLEDLMKLC